MTKNTYNPYEIMMDKYDKEEMLSDVRKPCSINSAWMSPVKS